MHSLNLCVLVGTLERPAIAVTTTDKPQQLARFTLTCTELGKDGVSYRLYVPVECYGQLAAQVLTLPSGAVLSVEGKLRWGSHLDKSGQRQGRLLVLAREARELFPGAEHASPAAVAVAAG